MSAFPNLDVRHAAWDKFRDAVIIPAGQNQIAISIEALESCVNRRLTPEEAVEAAVDEKALLAAIANATPAHDNVITITTGIMNSRSWAAEPYEEGPDDIDPPYLEPVNQARGDEL